jgi:hypothetical protein
LVASKNDQKTSGVVVFLGLSLGYDMGLFEAGYPQNWGWIDESSKMRCFATRKSQQSLSQGAKGRSKPASYSNFQEPKQQLRSVILVSSSLGDCQEKRNLWFDVALPWPTVPHSFIMFHHPSPSLVGVTKGPKTKVKLDQIGMIPSISKLSFPWKRRAWVMFRLKKTLKSRLFCPVSSHSPACVYINYVACSVWDRIPSETGLSRFATVFGFRFPSICRWSYLQELLGTFHPAPMLDPSHPQRIDGAAPRPSWWVKIGWSCCVRELESAIMGNPLENRPLVPPLKSENWPFISIHPVEPPFWSWKPLSEDAEQQWWWRRAGTTPMLLGWQIHVASAARPCPRPRGVGRCAHHGVPGKPQMVKQQAMGNPWGFIKLTYCYIKFNLQKWWWTG